MSPYVPCDRRYPTGLRERKQISQNRLQIQQGSLYPALYRLEHQGLIASEWGESENRRKAKYYRLTVAGRRRLKEELAYWRRFSEAIG
jgi:PadR family transcriptional regulator PadR